MDGEERAFSSPEEEIEYLKSLTRDYKQSLDDAREELDEFQIGSRELEAELEAQLEQQESKNKELNAANQRLQMEVDLLREKLEKQQTASHRQTNELEDELAQTKAFKDELQRYIRELEQSNDDLERAKRATVVSLEDFEARLNLAIERNAFLESELEEKECMSITVQRLKDEARDLREELAVTTVKSPGSSPLEEIKSPTEIKKMDMTDNIINTDNNSNIDSNKLADTSTYNTPPKTLHLNNMEGIMHHSNGTPLTPSARISALNIVGDLLRKVGALESKLASCRNFVKDQPRINKSGSNSPLNSPRAKRLHRSSTGPAVPVGNNNPVTATQPGYGVKITV